MQTGNIPGCQSTYGHETPVMTQSSGWSVHFHDKREASEHIFESRPKPNRLCHWLKVKQRVSGHILIWFQWHREPITVFFPSQQNNFAGGGTTIVTWCAACLPGHDDEEVQAVPGVSQVTATAKDPKGHHLYDHLQSEEDVDEGIKGLQGDAEWQRAVRKDAEETLRLDTFHNNRWRKLILLLRIK